MNIFETTLENLDRATWTKGRTFIAPINGFRSEACLVSIAALNELLLRNKHEAMSFQAFNCIPEQFRYRFSAIMNKLIMEHYPEFIASEAERFEMRRKPNELSWNISSLMVVWNDSPKIKEQDVRMLLEKGAAMYAEKYGV